MVGLRNILILWHVLSLLYDTYAGDTVVFPDASEGKSFTNNLENSTLVLRSGTVNDPHRICSCVPNHGCKPELPGEAQIAIDLRIVTPPYGVNCGPEGVYCCSDSHRQCGTAVIIPVSEVHIKPGQSRFGEYPWQVLILASDFKFVASGVLIDSFHVLTTAHSIVLCEKCMRPLIVRLGDWDVTGAHEPYGFVDVTVGHIVFHPRFDLASLQNDAALLWLTAPAVPAPHIKTLCLPPPGTYHQFLHQRCWVSGWGKNKFGPGGNFQNMQKKVDVPVIDHEDCERRLRATRLGPSFILDHHSFLCAGGEPDKDACTGDGGSPLVCEGRDGRFVLLGLVAWGVGCAGPGLPGVYVNVPSLLPWIQMQTQQHPLDYR